MHLPFCAASRPGARRGANQDGYCTRPDLGLFAVADGVGGRAGGALAARAALEALEQAIADTRGGTPDSDWPFQYQPALGVDGNRLNWAVHLASLRVRTETLAAGGREGMATTMAAVVIGKADERRGGSRGEEWIGLGAPVADVIVATIAHVGDSRIYRWRRGRLDPLTRDHSWVQEQVDAGRLTPAEARAHPRRNLLTRALSGGAPPVTDIGLVTIEPGDRLLLCTDGLAGALRDDEIEAIVGATYGTGPETTACDALVSAASLAGATDDVTVIVISVGASG